jgi:amino acid adenylation domain-containing protein
MDRTYIKPHNTFVDADKKIFPVLFADTANQYASNLALKFDSSEYTYQSINSKVNQYARFLLTNDVNIEDRVAIVLDRTPEMLITLLAVLKSGAAYLPLDPEYPKDRIEYMLNDSDTKLLITSKKYAGSFSANAQQLFIEDIWPQLNSLSTNEPDVAITGDNLAYILYTSGSTGRPKGVPVEHHNLSNLLLSMQKVPGITSTDVLLSVTTISFDIAALELFLPLISGATLVLTDSAAAKDSRLLLKTVRTQNVSIMQATPNTWRMMLESGWDEKLPLKVLCGGEALPLSLAKKLVTKCASLWNMYGPTETTIWSTLKQIALSDDLISIGKPIDDTIVYILDENDQPVAPGEQGEICIGGAGLARGYLNQPGLTAAKFINYNGSGQQNLRVYKTGDLGKFLPDGNIQCFGRIDHQVKISGFRIELGEIENVIQKSGLIAENVVLTKEDEDGNKNLVAYAIPQLAQVKLKEKELYKQQVDNWEKVYDTEYEQSGSQLQPDAKSQFDANVWTDSFTIKIIPVEQMQEWLADIIQVILAQKPQNVLEIGCGTGLIFYQLAPHIKKYIGTDISKSGINALSKEIDKEKSSFPETKLLACAGHEIALAPNEDIDTIIINSVIQYFPGEDYLTDVLSKSISLLNGNGKIIVSDVRDLRLLKVFKSYLSLSRLPADLDKKEFSYVVGQEILKEEELCVSPEYFYHLKSIFPQITHIDIQWKQGDYVNELISYRYAVIIYVGINNQTVTPAWQKWESASDAGSVRQLIQNKQPVIALSDVPNPRLAKEALLEQGLNDTAIYTTGDLSAYISSDNTECRQANNVIQVAKAQGYHCRFYVNADPLKLNLLLQLNTGDEFIAPLYNTYSQDKYAFTNIPLLATICTLMQRDVYKVLIEQLPNYMVPASLTILSQLPLTNNGKIDRQFLMQRNNSFRNQPSNYKPARTPVEKTLVSIWQELLAIDKVGISDNFFELGGNSLIAIRIMITLEKATGQDMPLSSLFEYPTIEQLAAIIQNTSNPPTGSKCLVRLKPEGNKIPLYIVHGWGLTVFIFKDLVKNLHPDQPVFALQGIGVDGFEEPLTKVEDIAARYISEILEQNPTGPYAFAGYSLGGVITCEIVKQLRIMGKQVTMLAMFDAYAHTNEKAAINTLFGFKKLNKFFLRIGHNITELVKDPNSWNEKMIQVNRKLPKWLKKSNIGKLKKDNDVDFYSNDLSKIYFAAAVQNYKLTVHEDIIELFRATKNIYYYMDDPICLGWQQYAKTVNMHRIKGSHTTMFLSPNYEKFAEILQQRLDASSLKHR